MLKSIAAAAAGSAVLLALGAAASPSAAQPLLEHWVDEGSGIAQEDYPGFCPEVDFTVEYRYHDVGTFVLGPRRGDDFLYGQSTHQGEWVWSNPANGTELTVGVRGFDRDASMIETETGFVIDVRDTVSFVVHTAQGTEHLVSGLQRHVVVIDDAGTHDDQSDDVVTSDDYYRFDGVESAVFCDIVAAELGDA